MAEFTGERLVPGQVDLDLYNEHAARYTFAARLARHKRVLDIACGAGYGSADLARVARHVIGIDISPEAVAAASAEYRAPNLQFLAAGAGQLPFKDRSFDLIVAFEVIEHLEDWQALLAEARRLLAPAGQFVVSTPNKLYYTDSRGAEGPNPFHVHEFEFEEFHAELVSRFSSTTMFLQNHVGAIAFQPAAGHGAVTAEMAAGGAAASPESSHFFLAVCALVPQTGAPLYLYLPSSSNVLREREQHILKLEAEIARKNEWLENLKSRHAELHEKHQELKEELEQKVAWALDLDKNLKSAQSRIVELQEQLEAHLAAARQAVEGYEAKIAELETELASRTERAEANRQRLESELEAKSNDLARCVEVLHETEKTLEERTAWARSLEERISQLEQLLEAASQSKWLRLGRRMGVGPDLQRQ